MQMPSEHLPGKLRQGLTSRRARPQPSPAPTLPPFPLNPGTGRRGPALPSLGILFFRAGACRIYSYVPLSVSSCLTYPASMLGLSGVRLGDTGVRLPGLLSLRERQTRTRCEKGSPGGSERGISARGGMAAQGPAASLCCSRSGPLLHTPACRTLPSALLGASDLRPTSRPKEGLCSQARVEPPGAGQVGRPQGARHPAAWLDGEVAEAGRAGPGGPPRAPSSQRTDRVRGEPPDLGSPMGADNRRPALPLSPDLRARVPGIPAGLEAGARLWGSPVCGSAWVAVPHTKESWGSFAWCLGDINHRCLFSVWSWRPKPGM